MRRSGALVLLALCLCGTAARAQMATATAATSDLGQVQQGQLMNTVTQMLGQGLANIGQKSSALMQNAANLKAAGLQSYNAAAQQLEAQVNAYEKNYCVASAFKPGSKKPATFVGHSFALTFDSGSCYFNDTAYLVDGMKELNCTEPSISFVTTPANFTSSYHAPAVFTGPYCQISKAFGEPMEKVLYVFDHTSSSGALDINTLAAQITTEVQKVLATMSSGLSNVGGFLFSGLLAGSGAGATAGVMAQ